MWNCSSSFPLFRPILSLFNTLTNVIKNINQVDEKGCFIFQNKKSQKMDGHGSTQKIPKLHITSC